MQAVSIRCVRVWRAAASAERAGRQLHESKDWPCLLPPQLVSCSCCDRVPQARFILAELLLEAPGENLSFSSF